MGDPTISRDRRKGPPGQWDWMLVMDGGAELMDFAVSTDLSKSWMIGDHQSKPIETNDQFAAAPKGTVMFLGEDQCVVISNGLEYGRTVVKVTGDEPWVLQQVMNTDLRPVNERETDDGV